MLEAIGANSVCSTQRVSDEYGMLQPSRVRHFLVHMSGFQITHGIKHVENCTLAKEQ